MEKDADFGFSKANIKRIVLGQYATEEKSYEIMAIPKLLEVLDLKGRVITIGATGYRRAIAARISDQGADYFLGLKCDQGTICDEVDDFFTAAMSGRFAGVAYDQLEDTDKGDGRWEVRWYWITGDLRTRFQHERWEGQRRIGMVEHECRIGQIHTIARR